MDRRGFLGTLIAAPMAPAFGATWLALSPRIGPAAAELAGEGCGGKFVVSADRFFINNATITSARISECRVGTLHIRASA